jgi:predicted transcriptional regulator
VNELCAALSLKPLAGEGGLDRAVSGCYIGDLLSWVMGRAGEDSAWITVMGNVNAIAVAKLADIACIILCENAHLDDAARLEADRNGIPVLAAEEPAFALSIKIAKLLGAVTQ